MPRDIGPDMLANLDRQLAAGKVDQAKYDARKIEVQELIRKGRAVEYSPIEKAGIVLGSMVLLVLGLWLLSSGSLPTIVLGLACIVGAFMLGRRRLF